MCIEFVLSSCLLCIDYVFVVACVCCVDAVLLLLIVDCFYADIVLIIDAVDAVWTVVIDCLLMLHWLCIGCV